MKSFSTLVFFSSGHSKTVLLFSGHSQQKSRFLSFCFFFKKKQLNKKTKNNEKEKH